jgi:hypothetical protein
MNIYLKSSCIKRRQLSKRFLLPAAPLCSAWRRFISKEATLCAQMFLVEAGHAATRSQAQRLIASGVEWRLTPLAPWKKVAKNGDDIPAGAELQLLDAAEAKYISRGGLKLEARWPRPA